MGKLVLGMGGVSCAKDVKLLVADENAAPDSFKKILKLKKKFSCPLLLSDDLEGLTGKDFCKVAAVQNGELADALLKLALSGEELKIYPDGDGGQNMTENR